MNRNIASVLVLAASAFATQAFAETPGIDAPFTGSKTRAEVQAELNAYKATGVNPWANQYNPLRYLQSTQSRAQVVGEYLASRDQVTAFTAEDSGSAYLAQAHRAVVDTSAAAE